MEITFTALLNVSYCNFTCMLCMSCFRTILILTCIWPFWAFELPQDQMGSRQQHLVNTITRQKLLGLNKSSTLMEYWLEFPHQGPDIIVNKSKYASWRMGDSLNWIWCPILDITCSRVMNISNFGRGTPEVCDCFTYFGHSNVTYKRCNYLRVLLVQIQWFRFWNFVTVLNLFKSPNSRTKIDCWNPTIHKN